MALCSHLISTTVGRNYNTVTVDYRACHVPGDISTALTVLRKSEQLLKSKGRSCEAK